MWNRRSPSGRLPKKRKENETEEGRKWGGRGEVRKRRRGGREGEPGRKKEVKREEEKEEEGKKRKQIKGKRGRW